jgi:hypothetical protein
MASRKAFNSFNSFTSSVADVDAVELLGELAWPKASPEANTTKHTFSRNFILRFLLMRIRRFLGPSRTISGSSFHPAWFASSAFATVWNFNHTIIGRKYIFVSFFSRGSNFGRKLQKTGGRERCFPFPERRNGTAYHEVQVIARKSGQ